MTGAFPHTLLSKAAAVKFQDHLRKRSLFVVRQRRIAGRPWPLPALAALAHSPPTAQPLPGHLGPPSPLPDTRLRGHLSRWSVAFSPYISTGPLHLISPSAPFLPIHSVSSALVPAHLRAAEAHSTLRRRGPSITGDCRPNRFGWPKEEGII